MKQIKSQLPNDSFRSNYDLIFGKKNIPQTEAPKEVKPVPPQEKEAK